SHKASIRFLVRRITAVCCRAAVDRYFPLASPSGRTGDHFRRLGVVIVTLKEASDSPIRGGRCRQDASLFGHGKVDGCPQRGRDLIKLGARALHLKNETPDVLVAPVHRVPVAEFADGRRVKFGKGHGAVAYCVFIQYTPSAVFSTNGEM